jgi:hypothetical protein
VPHNSYCKRISIWPKKRLLFPVLNQHVLLIGLYLNQKTLIMPATRFMTTTSMAVLLFLLPVQYVTAGIAFDSDSTMVKKRYLNFFIIAPPKKGRLDLAARYNTVRGKLNGFLQRKKFVAIVAKDAKQMSEKVRSRLQKSSALIGTLWFDSHGFYKKGYSLFYIGHDEFSYKTTKDSMFVEPLRQLTARTDEHSRIVIGSCYGGATYSRKSLYNNDTLRMNGDSLMMGLGNIFTKAAIIGSESWVMTKPGLFTKKTAVVGFPARRLFRDVVYQPVWQRVGQWNIYYPVNRQFLSLNGVTMDRHGNLLSFKDSYASSENTRRKIERKMKRLKPGLLDMKKI